MNETQPTYRYVLLIVGVLLVGAAGYVGYLLYPRFDQPAVSGIGLMVLAVGAGVGSLFAPCSFPMLVTILAREIKGEGPATGRALRYGGALALGVTTFLLLLGIVISLGGGSTLRTITFTSTPGRIIRVIVGSLLLTLGLVQLEVLTAPFHKVAKRVKAIQRTQAKLRRQRPELGFALYGFIYVLVGFG